MDCVAARVAAILVRYRTDDSEPEYRHRIRCERWEVVLPELVFAPARRDRDRQRRISRTRISFRNAEGRLQMPLFHLRKKYLLCLI
jgi:hypothetical protein